MEDLFISAVNISIVASFLVLAIIIFRLFAKKTPKWVFVLLWGFVGLRLLLPFNIESALSLIPSKATIPTTITHDRYPTLDTGFEALDEIVNPILSSSMEARPEYSANPMHTWTTALGWVWIGAMICMLTFMAGSFIYLRIKTRVKIEREDSVFLCDYVKTPFILGIIKPYILLPSGISERDYSLVLAHERAHIKRLDHIWKPLGFLLLSVYWFNPLLWIAYVFLCRDIESACDEKVISNLEDSEKADYSEALLTLGIKSRVISACPLAFGEVSVKSRVSAVAKYKKPATALVIASLLICTLFAACFLTYKKKEAVAIDAGIWYAGYVISDRNDGESCEDVPRLVFTEGGDLLAESNDLSDKSYLKLGVLNSAYISKKEYEELFDGAKFREGYDTEYLSQNVKAVYRISPGISEMIDADEVYLLRTNNELFMGYASGGVMEVLYKLNFNETLPTYLYVSKYTSPDIFGASLILDTSTRTGRIIFGNGTSYDAIGKYTYENSRLTFTTGDDFALKLVFIDVGERLIFSERDSDTKGLAGLLPDSAKFAVSYELYNAGTETKWFDIDGDKNVEFVFVNISDSGKLNYIVHRMGTTLANKTLDFENYDYVSLTDIDGALYLIGEYKEGDLKKYYYKLSFDGENLHFNYEER